MIVSHCHSHYFCDFASLSLISRSYSLCRVVLCCVVLCCVVMCRVVIGCDTEQGSTLELASNKRSFDIQHHFGLCGYNSTVRIVLHVDGCFLSAKQFRNKLNFTRNLFNIYNKRGEWETRYVIQRELDN